jgi:HEAT repeat protein
MVWGEVALPGVEAKEEIRQPEVSTSAPADDKGIEVVRAEKGIVLVGEESDISAELLHRLNSPTVVERAGALADLARLGGDDASRIISKAFDDESADVRNAAARALYDVQPDRAASFTRALREGTPERRRNIGASLASSGLASDAIANLTGESREKTYDAFSLLFLMAKAGEVQPLMKAIEDYPNIEVRLAVVKLLALSGQPEIVPAFRRLAVRGSLPSEVRSAVMEAIYQISSQNRETAPSAA